MLKRDIVYCLAELAIEVYKYKERFSSTGTEIILNSDGQWVITDNTERYWFINEPHRVSDLAISFGDLSIFPKTQLEVIDQYSHFECLAVIMSILDSRIKKVIKELNSDLPYFHHDIRKYGEACYVLIEDMIDGYSCEEKLANYIDSTYGCTLDNVEFGELLTPALLKEKGQNPSNCDVINGDIAINGYSVNVSFRYTDDHNLSLSPLSKLSLISFLVKNQYRFAKVIPAYSQLDNDLNLKNLSELIGYSVLMKSGLQDFAREKIVVEEYSVLTDDKNTADSVKKELIWLLEKDMHELGLFVSGSIFHRDLSNFDNPKYRFSTLLFKRINKWIEKYSKYYSKTTFYSLFLENIS